jgi:hypothetical protein
MTLPSAPFSSSTSISLVCHCLPLLSDVYAHLGTLVHPAEAEGLHGAHKLETVLTLRWYGSKILFLCERGRAGMGDADLMAGSALDGLGSRFVAVPWADAEPGRLR